MEKREQLYEGKAKKVFATDDPDVVIVSYKDDATAFNGVKKGHDPGQGRDQQPHDEPRFSEIRGCRHSHAFYRGTE